ncbi:MAG: glutaredoxin-like protein NrdH [Actinomycetaceae bacterium]|nr:glutaredoxin-like protein NrdH [Actinomycetaceae bacterium]
MSITVYSKPMCVQCDATKRALNKQDLDYEVIDMTVDMEALEYVKSLGYVQAPVVMAGDQHWSGYRPDLIKKLAKEAAAVVNG